MIDFHSHILPGIDDGAETLSVSLEMLEESRNQGVDTVFLTPHFYADETDPTSFLRDRSRVFEALKRAAAFRPTLYPQLRLGAEVLYYPGMSETKELRSLVMEGTPFLMIEPPMIPWRESVLQEIEDTGKNIGVIPVIAHIDRYMRILQDYSLPDRIRGRRMLAQVNASYFLHGDTRERALQELYEDRFQFIGSDCHNMDDRAPNMGYAAQIIENSGLSQELLRLNNRLYSLL